MGRARPCADAADGVVGLGAASFGAASAGVASFGAASAGVASFGAASFGVAALDGSSDGRAPSVDESSTGGASDAGAFGAGSGACA